jgi:hypothetical protein
VLVDNFYILKTQVLRTRDSPNEETWDCLTEHMARRKLDFEMLKMVDSNLFDNPDLSLNKKLIFHVRFTVTISAIS